MEKSWWKTPFDKLRMIGYVEGISYLILLGIAMPLKYYYAMPQAVKIVGMAHGVLFILYIVALMNATLFYKWGIMKAMGAFVASLIPFGTFYLDRLLMKEKET